MESQDAEPEDSLSQVADDVQHGDEAWESNEIDQGTIEHITYILKHISHCCFFVFYEHSWPEF